MAQEVYSNSYNWKHGVVLSFRLETRSLRGTGRKTRKSKLKRPFTGPYEIVSISNNESNLYLKEKYSHFLKKSVAVNHLVKFHENKMYKVDDQTKFMSELDADVESMSTDDDFIPDQKP